VQADNPRTRQWLAEMVARDYNHPCIIGWSPGNEIAKHFDYVRTMNEYIRTELDPHRLVSYISNTGARPASTPQNDPITFNDIAMINVYAKSGGAFDHVSKTLHGRWPDKPVFFSEYGVSQIGAKPDAVVPGLEDIWEGISGESYVIGGSLWTFNDYRSGFKNTPPSGNREWGVVDVHRNPKTAYQQVRKLYCPVRSLAIADGKIRLEPRSPKEIPCYTLRGYKVKWEINTTGGAIKSSGVIDLPEIKPGSPAIGIPLPSAAVSEIHLVAPTGYTVADCQG